MPNSVLNNAVARFEYESQRFEENTNRVLEGLLRIKRVESIVEKLEVPAQNQRVKVDDSIATNLSIQIDKIQKSNDMLELCLSLLSEIVE